MSKECECPYAQSGFGETALCGMKCGCYMEASGRDKLRQEAHSGDVLARAILLAAAAKKPEGVPANLIQQMVGGADMMAPDGPICWCGEPSREQSGWCGECDIDEVISERLKGLKRVTDKVKEKGK